MIGILRGWHHRGHSHRAVALPRAVRDLTQLCVRLKGKPINAQKVAKELSVQYVVEGSVRKAGSRVRKSGREIRKRGRVCEVATHGKSDLLNTYLIWVRCGAITLQQLEWRKRKPTILPGMRVRREKATRRYV